MKLHNNLDEKFTADWFKSLANQFVGLKATLFAYSPGFDAIYVAFEKNNRYFLLKFSRITYVQAFKEWTFGGIEVQKVNVEDYDDSIYKFFDADSFEVICKFFGLVEIINGSDVWGN